LLLPRPKLISVSVAEEIAWQATELTDEYNHANSEDRNIPACPLERLRHSATLGSSLMGNHKTPRRDKSALSVFGTYLTLAMTLPVSAVVGYFMGLLLDKVFHTHFLYIVFLILGIVSGFVQLFRQVMRDSGP
jgi:F0F1-type ATP synthase assembly protein I